jgi:hypothetical protein
MVDMGGSSGPQRSEVTTTQTNLPDYARSYYENMMDRAGAALNTTYQPYTGARTAGFTPAQEQIQANTLAMGAPNQFATGSAMTYQAGQRALAQPNYAAAQFNPNNVSYQQQQANQMAAVPNVSSQQQQANQMATAQTNYNPNLQAFQFGPTREVSAQQVNAPIMQAAQSSYGQGPLEQFRMSGPQQFGQQQASEYMSPYMQNVVETQKREATRDARRGQIAQDLGSARQGTYGGSRQLLASLERERNLGTQLGDIQARGSQAAYENAQQQFERDRAAGLTTGQQNLDAALRQQQLGVQTGTQMALANLSNEQQARVNNQAMNFQAQGMNAENALRAALANQGVDVTRAQANLQSQLGTQELGANIGMQTSLANLAASQQANAQNLAARQETQGLNAQQAMQAMLANQQAGLTTGQANLAASQQTQGLNAEQAMRAMLANQSAGLDAQRASEQSRQFGAQQGLSNLSLAAQTGQTLSNIGAAQQNTDLQRLNAQAAAAGQQQALQQQMYDQRYADFLRQRDYPMEVLGNYSNLLRGLPMALNSATTTYAPRASAAQSVLGAGLGAAGLSRALGS